MADKVIMLSSRATRCPVESAESYGSIGLSKGLIKSELTVPMTNTTAAMKQQVRMAAKEKYLAMLMLDGLMPSNFHR
jgi:hypothetical protein